MLGSFKPVAFDPYGKRRSRARVPPWLLLLLAGAVIGAGGVIIAQAEYLPPRLSVEASAKLRDDYDKAESERVRLAAELATTAKALDTERVEKQRLASEVDNIRNASSGLRADVAALVEALPADPRGGAVEVRSANFSVANGNLNYDIVLTRARPGDKPLPGVMQLIVSGGVARAAKSSVSLEPVTVSIGLYQSLRGELPLPDGFAPRQTTVKVTDPDGRVLGLRVLNVK